MGTRRRGRELALQALYLVTLAGDEAERSLEEFWPSCEGGAEARSFGRRLVEGVREGRERIDALIAASSEHWRLGRLSRVDLNILRVATYELLSCPEVPTRVVIDEAIEIAKRFGSSDSPTFVNGVLDHVASSIGAPPGSGAPSRSPSD